MKTRCHGRRKGEVTSAMNDEISRTSLSCRSRQCLSVQSDNMLAFHRERGIGPPRGRGWQRRAVLCALLLRRSRAR
jgi:hypothetical protein